MLCVCVDCFYMRCLSSSPAGNSHVKLIGRMSRPQRTNKCSVPKKSRDVAIELYAVWAVAPSLARRILSPSPKHSTFSRNYARVCPVYLSEFVSEKNSG